MSFALALVLAMQPAPSAAEGMITIGIGGDSCRKWTQAKAAKAGDRIVYEQWLLGFVTGLDFANQGLGSPVRVSVSDDPNDLIGFIDDYCAKNPLEKVATAAQYLWLELFKRSQRK